MSNQTQPDQPTQPLERRTRRPRRRRRGGGLWFAVTLILLGGIFLLQQLGWLGQRFNWWAIFILIPALATLGGAWAMFQRSGGRFNAVVRGSLGSGAVILTVALMFLFDLDWGVWWPLMLIVPGAALFMGSLSDPDVKLPRQLARWANLGLWIGAAVAGLGLAFLLQNLGALSFHALFGSFQWWGVFVLIPGIGALVNAWIAYVQNGRQINWTAQGLLIVGAALCVLAALTLIGLAWNLLAPLLLIVGGLALLLGFLGRRG